MSAPKTQQQQQQQQPSADDGGANGGAGVVQPRRGPLDPREEKHPVLLLEGNPIRYTKKGSWKGDSFHNGVVLWWSVVVGGGSTVSRSRQMVLNGQGFARRASAARSTGVKLTSALCPLILPLCFFSCHPDSSPSTPPQTLAMSFLMKSTATYVPYARRVDFPPTPLISTLSCLRVCSSWYYSCRVRFVGASHFLALRSLS